MRIQIDDLKQFCVIALETVGARKADAATTADALTTADAWGIFTHGTKLLAGYIPRLREGGWNAKGTPRVDREGPAWTIVDGDHALGQVGGDYAMRRAIATARRTGFAYVGLKNTGHIGAAGYFASLAAREGMIGVAMGNDIPSVAAPHSRGAVLGSNPIAYAIPAGGRDPILLDMATAAVAGGKVYAAWQRGEPIPPTWIVGPDGKPTTDGSLYPAHAALAPMAGHKGFGLGLLVETLAGLLTCGAVTRQVGSWLFDDPALPTRHNAAFLAIDVAAIAPRDEFSARVDALIDEIHAAPKAEGADRIFVPGEMEWERRRKALAEGIDLPSDVRDKLQSIAKDLHLSDLWIDKIDVDHFSKRNLS